MTDNKPPVAERNWICLVHDTPGAVTDGVCMCPANQPSPAPTLDPMFGAQHVQHFTAPVTSVQHAADADLRESIKGALFCVLLNEHDRSFAANTILAVVAPMLAKELAERDAALRDLAAAREREVRLIDVIRAANPLGWAAHGDHMDALAWHHVAVAALAATAPRDATGTEPRGLYGKYRIAKADGSPVDPEADYFVLRLDTDGRARHAARTYARDIESINPALAADLRARCSRYTPAEQGGDVLPVNDDATGEGGTR